MQFLYIYKFIYTHIFNVHIKIYEFCIIAIYLKLMKACTHTEGRLSHCVIKTYILCLIGTVYIKMQTFIGMCAYISCSVPSYKYTDTDVHIFNNLCTGRVSSEL